MKNQYIIILSLFILFSCKKSTEKEYFTDGSIKSVTEIKNGLHHGKYKIFHNSGVLLSEGYNKEGLAHGVFKEYYENGQVKEVGTYVNDSLEGRYLSYFENGILQKDLVLKNNQIVLYKDFYITGQVKSIRQFDVKSGENLIKLEKFDKNGRLIEDYSKVKISILKDSINIGDELTFMFELLGNIPCGKILYGVVEPYLATSGLKNREGCEIDKKGNIGVYTFKTKKKGLHFIQGVVKLECDSMTFPRFYQFKDSFVVR